MRKCFHVDADGVSYTNTVPDVCSAERVPSNAICKTEAFCRISAAFMSPGIRQYDSYTQKKIHLNNMEKLTDKFRIISFSKSL